MMRMAVAAMFLATCLSMHAQEPPPARPEFGPWLEEVRAEALLRGLKPETVAAAFDGLEPLEVVVQRDRSQAESVVPLDTYVQQRLAPRFVRTAREQLVAQRKTLTAVATKYGVQARFLVAVWALESNFGRFSGVRPTVQALATLAWEGRRGPFFKGELFNALEIVERGDIELAVMKGSWAGAMGQPQFMPSSYLAHAQDFDGDGRRDIWTSLPDVFASIGNYLKAYGWQPEQTWGREVKLPAGRDLLKDIGRRESGCRAEREMTAALPLAKWQVLGVRAVGGAALPKADIEASLLRAGQKTFLVYRNYESLLGYNCAHAYALAVSQLADRAGALK